MENAFKARSVFQQNNEIITACQIKVYYHEMATKRKTIGLIRHHGHSIIESIINNLICKIRKVALYLQQA